MISRLFSPKSAQKAVEGLYKGVDAAVFTEQERKELALDWLKALEPFRVVQRILVSIIMGMWSIVGINYMFALWVEAIYPDLVISEAILEFAKTEFMWMPVVAAVGVYLGGGLKGIRKAP